MKSNSSFSEVMKYCFKQKLTYTSNTKFKLTCVYTSKPRSVITPYKTSKFNFRQKALFNKLCGIKKTS